MRQSGRQEWLRAGEGNETIKETEEWLRAGEGNETIKETEEWLRTGEGNKTIKETKEWLRAGEGNETIKETGVAEGSLILITSSSSSSSSSSFPGAIYECLQPFDNADSSRENQVGRGYRFGKIHLVREDLGQESSQGQYQVKDESKFWSYLQVPIKSFIK
ncbi:hypothetical protein EYF80_021065 [Liparis tanakae]|uniref:Uncharacterized protein n=1 Tax=Liparis tanakae TaxID=230148 RepID=A0A4Z2HUW4_9TELE|nr:hypothetical protein EYF80_021065 [Liparis tanakae]